MKKHGYISEKTEQEEKVKKDQWKGATIKNLNLNKAITVPAALGLREAIEIMKKNGFDQLPVTSASDSRHCIGLITLGGVLAKIGSGRRSLDDTCESAMYHFKINKKFVEITEETPLENLTKFFEKFSSAVVTQRSKLGELLVVSVVTKVDLLSFLTKR
jgi:cystathionine beta-synthase